MADKQKRSETPQKSQGNSKKKLFKPDSEQKELKDRDSIDGNMEEQPHGNASYAAAAAGGGPRAGGGGGSDAPPKWFVAFEDRMDSRFERLRRDLSHMVDEVKEALHFHEQMCDDKISKLQKEIQKFEEKLDDLENRSRRNNLVFFGIPEGEEKASGSVQHFMFSFLSNIVPGLQEQDIERSHRTPSGPPPRPDASGKVKTRPIHICFSSFQKREKVRKSFIQVFKSEASKERKLFVGDDLSHRIQAQRKKLLPSLQNLRKAGKKAFFVYPATIKYVDGQTVKVFKPSE